MIGVLMLGIMGVFAISFAAGLVVAVAVSGRKWNVWLMGALAWGLCLWAWLPAFAFAGFLAAEAVGYKSTPSVGVYYRPDIGISVTIVPSLCIGLMLSRGTGRKSVLWLCAIMGLVASALVTGAYVLTGGIVWEATILGWLGLWAFEERAVNRLKRGECPRCRYDLAGLPPGAVCPECAREPSSAQS